MTNGTIPSDRTMALCKTLSSYDLIVIFSRFITGRLIIPSETTKTIKTIILHNKLILKETLQTKTNKATLMAIRIKV